MVDIIREITGDNGIFCEVIGPEERVKVACGLLRRSRYGGKSDSVVHLEVRCRPEKCDAILKGQTFPVGVSWSNLT